MRGGGGACGRDTHHGAVASAGADIAAIFGPRTPQQVLLDAVRRALKHAQAPVPMCERLDVPHTHCQTNTHTHTHTSTAIVP
jgi:hypothetical protein